ncbi:MAG: AraC family transcriptional regulator [Clostridiales bacterium]|jgi:AraC-like DNA-binding protein|nr:AraC family transcriptional regulator [Clostridiales bacterium]
MTKRETKKQITQILSSGYNHQSSEEEQSMLTMLLKDGVDFRELFTYERLAEYNLAPQPLRSFKNTVICLVAVVCRIAVKLGAYSDECFALADHYIFKVEEMKTIDEVCELAAMVMEQYAQIVKEKREKNYSLPVLRSIRYINRHLFGVIRIKDIADEIGIHPNYLSTLFKAELGMPLTQYIRTAKLKETKELLLFSKYSVGEISEMLGYSNSSHFAREFKKEYGCAPSEFAAAQMTQI